MDLVTRARGLIGTRFRAQGRDPALGLDCVGLAAAVYGVRIERAYPQRGGDVAGAAADAAALGLRPIAPEAAGPGDLIMMAAGAGRLHVAVLTPGGFVHADARLGRVVETPGRPAWPVVAAWRSEGGSSS